MSECWPLPERFCARLTMLSDWHVGSGMGRPGSVDRLVTRDAEDLPFVPAKTLRGIWRDACERLCRALDDGQVGAWSQTVDRLFGSQPALGAQDPSQRHTDPAAAPLESAVQIRPACIPAPLRERLIHADRRLRQALTFLKPGVKIDRRSGSAQTDFLRFEEVARKKTILEAECRLPLADPDTRQLASALLIASARLVERLGGKRRRGAGRCKLEIVVNNQVVDHRQAVDWLKQCQNPPEWRQQTASHTEPQPPHASPASDPWICVPLVLQLHGPLAVSCRTTGNVVETLDFVPGSYLLPHITRTLLELRSGVAAGDVVVLAAYPEVDGERGQPVPMAWFAPKGQDDPLQAKNCQKLVNRLLQGEPADGTQLKQMREGYVSDHAAKVYKPPITVRTHNTVDDKPQRPTSDVGGVYTYEAIAPSDRGAPVVLRSELRIRKSLADRLQAEWYNRLSAEIAIGRSKKDDYGWVRLVAESASQWKSSPAIAGGELFVWLVSDTLIRSARLRPEPTASCLGEELSRRLGVRLRLRGSSDGRLDEFVRLRRLDTWHVGWGLPRPSLVALQAGSCMVFQVENGSLDPHKLAELQASGIGERTAEGYGQLRFNHPLLTRLPTEWPVSSSSDMNSPRATIRAVESNDPAFEFARLLERECWKQELRRACLAIASDRGRRKELLGWVASGEQGQPPMSQLGGFRQQLAWLRTATDQQRILDWLDHLDANPRRNEKWPSIGKVRDFVADTGRIWKVIHPDQWPTLTDAASHELKQELWALAVRTFFDACIRAHKRELEKQQSQPEAAHGA
jgi:CRISPR-associated protein Csx10